MFTAGRAGNMEKPMSIGQIVKLASEPFFDADFSMQNWFRTAQLMLKQANVYEHEGNDQMAYLLLYRYSLLILDYLAKHPNARDPELRSQWSEARKAVKTCLAKLELLKPRINKRYERYEERRKVAVAARAAESTREGPRRPSDSILANEHGRTSQESQASREASPASARLDVEEHQDMAVELANRQMHRRGVGGATTQASSLSLQNIRRQLDRRTISPGNTQVSHNPTSGTTYSYPHVPDHTQQPPAYLPPKLGGRPDHDHFVPTPPPKDSLQPLRPSKTPLLPSKTEDPQPYSTTSSNLPSSPQLQARQFSTISNLESGAPLRTLFLPTPLRHAFTRIATPNTNRNLETCGMLCGTLIRNAFFITHLVIPEQTATSDTCEMVNETSLYEYIDSHSTPPGDDSNTASGELMVLGWIHTHPTQTCFLSSRDLHTHVWYQVQLAESIAIVCAPSKKPDYGIFRITDPPGMPTLKACKQTGIFHPHEVDDLYTDALGRPGHVIEHEELRFEVVDLRKKG